MQEATAKPQTEARRLYISHVAELDWLTALEFGRVDDGQPEDSWRPLGPQFAYMHALAEPGSPPVGFKVIEFSSFDAEDRAYEGIWEEPLFEAPQLGLPAACAGEIILATRNLYGGYPSLNRHLFDAATQLDGPEAVDAWTACLQAGDSMAHFALGYTLFELGETRSAYRHLRYYAALAPNHPWNHCWYGRAAEAIGETQEAVRAYQRAIALTHEGGEQTDAAELLAALLGRLGQAPGED